MFVNIPAQYTDLITALQNYFETDSYSYIKPYVTDEYCDGVLDFFNDYSFMYDELEGYAYVLKDLDGNGIPELMLIQNNTDTIYDLYTIADEKLVHMFHAWARNTLSLTPSDRLINSDDVSLIIGRNRETGDIPNMYSLMSMTNINILPIINDVPIEIITFLDPSIEKLYFENSDIHLKFKDSEEIIVSKAIELEQYLSSGTIKGITAFSMAREVFISGGYLVIDEIENHFNKEIVATLTTLSYNSYMAMKKNFATLGRQSERRIS